MKKNLEINIRDKKAIYLGDKQLLPDVFDYVDKFKGFIIAHSPDCLTIVNPNGEIIVSEKDVFVCQVFNHGEYISLRKNNVMGIYLYDGTIVVPFEFYMTFISDKGIEVKKNESDLWELYN